MQVTDNPFREGLERSAAPEPCVFVLFGATGDLTARKLLPALYNLAREGLLPRDFYVLGVARRPKSDEDWRHEMREAVDRFSRNKPQGQPLLGQFAERIGYHQTEFHDPDGYRRLVARLEEIDRTHGTQGNRLYYLAVAPEFFTLITDELHNAGLLQRSPEGAWHRLVVEKPFGTDLASAHDLSRHLRGLVDEKQIYRIDHYLGKETVQNLLTMRFGNGIFEPLWNRRYVDHVQITVSETHGIGRRGEFYDETGALRDMVQNHMMQLLALTAMEPPVAWDADAIRDEKSKVLRGLPRWTPEEVARHVVRGRYTSGFVAGEAVPGYLEESGVDRASTTETFVAMRLNLETWRWSGVPFYLRHGKRLPKRASEIAVVFKQPPLGLFPGVEDHNRNTLVMRIQPDEGVSLNFMSKVPGMRLERRQVRMDFNYGSAFGVPSPEAYERLLLDAMSGDSTLFTREDEVDAAWRFVGAIQEAWAQQPPSTVSEYAAGSWGPTEADALLLDAAEWRRL